MLGGILIIFLLLGVALISRSMTTFVHEMGHAIPSLFFTKGEVVVCVGSYGDVGHSLAIRIGRLKIFLKFNFLSWNLGLCSHQGTNGFWKTMIVIVGGPLASLILAFTLVYLIIVNEYSDTTIAVLTFFILSAIWDFGVNIYPVSTPFYLFDGSEVYNDGQRFLNLIKRRNYPEEYYTAMEYSANLQYDKAIQAFKQLLEDGFNTKEVNNQIISNLMKNKEYDEALKHFGSYLLRGSLKARDYYTLGSIYVELKRYREAVKCLNKAIHIEYQNVEFLNKRGMAFAELDAFENALRDFNAAIYYNPNYLMAYLNRAYLKIKTDDPEGGLADLQYVLEIDEIPQTYLYLGHYYKKKGNYGFALENFEKAKTLHSDEPELDFLIGEMQAVLKKREKS